MEKTKPVSLLMLFIAAAITLYAAEMVLVRLGEPQFTPPITLGVALGFIGVVLPVLAWPIKKSTRVVEGKPQAAAVNPFYATRVLLLGKAGALTGAIMAGAGAGVLVFVSTRMVIATGPIVLAIVTLVGAIVLTGGSLLAEKWCQIPPPSSESAREGLSEGEPA